ncbi:MAG: hypothetical protein ACTSUS_01865 [Candidatus Freyarchaeota archaeon]
MSGKLVKVKSWEEFKRLIAEHNPKSIVYRIEQGIPAGNLTGLRLILPAEGIEYVFVDTASGGYLRKTGIPLRRDKLGNIYVEDEGVINFVRAETKRKNLKFHSYWTI